MPPRWSTIPALMWTLTAPSPLAAQTRVPTVWERSGTLPIDESSGVALSTRFPGILWTHDDSGADPVVYAVRADGSLVASFHVLGARAVDWEDIALGPCPWETGRTCLALGDIGDNAEERTRVIVYLIQEPDPHTATDSLSPVGPARAVRIRYTDRPHDAEALALDPDGNLTIVTKGRSGPVLRYTIPRRQLLADSTSATPADTLPIVPQRMLGRWVTGAAIRNDGQRAVVRTYTEVFFFRISDGRWIPDGPGCFFGPREAQGEAVDFLDDTTLILTSERANGAPAIHRVRCPAPSP